MHTAPTFETTKKLKSLTVIIKNTVYFLGVQAYHCPSVLGNEDKKISSLKSR